MRNLHHTMLSLILLLSSSTADAQCIGGFCNSSGVGVGYFNNQGCTCGRPGCRCNQGIPCQNQPVTSDLVNARNQQRIPQNPYVQIPQQVKSSSYPGDVRKLVTVYTSANCSPCDRWEKDFNSDNKYSRYFYSKYRANVIQLTSDADHKRYNIEGTPTFRISGQDDIEGYSNPNDFLWCLDNKCPSPSKYDPAPKSDPISSPPIKGPVASTSTPAKDGSPGRDGRPGRDGIDGKSGRDGKDAEIDYDKLVKDVTAGVLASLKPDLENVISRLKPEPVDYSRLKPEPIDYERITSHVIARMPKPQKTLSVDEIVSQVIKQLPESKKKIYYSIEPLTVK